MRPPPGADACCLLPRHGPAHRLRGEGEGGLAERKGEDRMGGGGRDMVTGHSWGFETKEPAVRTVRERPGTQVKEGEPSVTDTAEGAKLSLGPPLSVHTALSGLSASPSTCL